MITRDAEITLAQALAIAMEVSDDGDSDSRRRYLKAARELNIEADVLEYLTGTRPAAGLQ